MATRFDAIAASELRDTQGEILDVKGADISELVAGRGIINDNHSNKLPDVIGRITSAKKIFGPEDCENERQKYYWNKVKAPYIYTEGLLYDDEDHRSAKAAAAIIKHQFKTDSPLKMKCSVEGGILERGQKDQRVLKRTKIRGLALTLTPANNATLVEGLDLAKSAPTAEEIDLIKSYAPHAVVDVPALIDLSQRTSIAKIRENVEKIHETVSALKKNTSLVESLEKASKKQLLQQLGSDPKATEVADWLSKDVKRDDVQQWFLRNYKKDPGIYNDKNKQAVNHYVGTANIHQDHDIGMVRFDKSHSFEDGMRLWGDAEQKLQNQTKGANNLLKPDEKTKKLIDLGNGWGWYDLGKGYDEAEGKAMSHCGNIEAKDAELDPDHPRHRDNILSLRKEHNINGETYHEPRLSFIENQEYLGETKGFGNSKPAAKYHDAIIELLKHSRIKENIGGGYAPNNNFYLNDLPKDKLDKLLKEKPNLERLWLTKSGKINPEDYPEKHADDAASHNYALDLLNKGRRHIYQSLFRDVDSSYAKSLIKDEISNPSHKNDDEKAETISQILIRSPHLDKSHIDQAFDSYSSYLEHLLSSHAANKNHILRALDYEDKYVRRAAVLSPHFKPEHMDKALNDEHPEVRSAAVMSPHFKPEHMDRALNDEDEEVRLCAVRWSPHFKPEHFDKAFNDESHFVRAGAVESPHFKPEHFDKAFNDESSFVRRRAVESPHFKPEHMNKALNDENYAVRCAAIDSPHFKPEYLDKVLNDKNSVVRHVALNSPHYQTYLKQKGLTKALTAGYGGAEAPNLRSGGSVLQAESLEKASKKQLLQQLGSDPKAAEVANWLSKDVKRDDVQQWFLRNYKKDPSIYNDKNKQAVVHYVGTADIHKDHDIGRIRFDKSHSFEDGMKLWGDAEQKLQSQAKGANNLLKPDDKTKKLIDLGNGWGWYDLGKGYDEAEGKAMSHCGNADARGAEEDAGHSNHHDRILSLRKEHNINGETYHEPRLSFIENQGFLGETKGFGNSKPAEKYHDAIIELLKHPRIKENIGGGYAPSSNFYLNDLPKDKLDKLLKDKPNLEKLWLLKSGQVDPEDYPEKHADDAASHNYALDLLSKGSRHLNQSLFRDVDPKYAKSIIKDVISGKMDDVHTDEGQYIAQTLMRSPHLDKSHIDLAFDVNSEYLSTLLSSHAANKDHIRRALDHNSPHVRRAAISSPHFKAEYMDKALSDKDLSVRLAATKSPRFKAEHFDKAFNDDHELIREAAVKSPHFKAEHYDKAYNDSADHVRAAAIESPHFKAEHFDKAFNDDHELIREAAVRSFHFKPEHMDRALNDEGFSVRAAAIESPHFKAEHMDRALNDEEDENVLRAIKSPVFNSEHIDKALAHQGDEIIDAVVNSPHFNVSHMDKALSHKNKSVRAAAVKSPHFKAEHYDKVYNDPANKVRLAAIYSPHFKAEHMDRALNDEDFSIRLAAVNSPHFKPEHMDRALNDQSGLLRLAAVRSPHFNLQHMDKALNDEYDFVREAAQKSPHYQTYLKQKGLNKALTAGYGGAEAPNLRTGGSVLQTESLDQGRSFRYIDCPNCGKEQVYMSHQTKCRSCNKSFPFDTLAMFFLNKPQQLT